AWRPLVLPGGLVGAEHDGAAAGPVQLGVGDRVAVTRDHQGLDEAEDVAQEADLGSGVAGLEGREDADAGSPAVRGVWGVGGVHGAILRRPVAAVISQAQQSWSMRCRDRPTLRRAAGVRSERREPQVLP